MAATTAGAVKAWLESAGLGIAVYRDSVPSGATYPYVTVSEGISITSDRQGDNGAGPVSETIQVDVWQRVGAESTTLTDALYQRLEGGRLPAGRTTVYGTSVDFSTRFVERDTGTVHHAITVTVRRTLEAAGA